MMGLFWFLIPVKPKKQSVSTYSQGFHASLKNELEGGNFQALWRGVKVIVEVASISGSLLLQGQGRIALLHPLEDKHGHVTYFGQGNTIRCKVCHLWVGDLVKS